MRLKQPKSGEVFVRGSFRCIKKKEKIGPLKVNKDELVNNYENMSTLLNDYILSVFTQDDRTTIPERVRVYEGESKLSSFVWSAQRLWPFAGEEREGKEL